MALDLNEKPWYVALLIGLVLGVALFFVINHYVFAGIRDKIEIAEDEISELERDVQKGRAAKRDLPKLEEEIQSYEIELERLKRILPTKRETDELIKKLKQLTERGRFRLLRFSPKDFVDRDFYWEWPISVELEGTYHELGLFFDRLSRFSRIINVANLRVQPVSSRGSDATISADFTSQTFIYKEESEGAGGAR